MNQRISRPRAWRRRFSTIATAAIIGTAVAWRVHGEPEAMATFAMVSFATAVVLLGIGAFLNLSPRAAKAGSFVTRCGVVVFLAIPAGFLATRLMA